MKKTAPLRPFTGLLLAACALSSSHAATTCFYENYDYKGASWCTDAASGDIQAPVVDKVSAVKVPAGTQVTLYQHPGFTGKTLTLGGDTPNLSSLAFNNLASSFKVAGGAPAAPALDILFVGNSFTHGNFAPTVSYNAANVDDLNGSHYGGVPGIFKQLTVEAGLSWAAHIEAVSSMTLQWHYQNKLAQIGQRPWDVVVLQEQSELDPSAPGNPASLVQYAGLLEQFVHGGANAHPNPAARVFLLATWPRADALYSVTGDHWYGKTVEQMNADLHAGYAQAAAADAAITGVLPVGDAFVRAIAQGVADRNPYDGIDAGKVNLWAVDGHHASAFGSYLEALVAFGRITGVDPRKLGAGSKAASDLGLTSAQASQAQTLAWEQLDAAR